MARRTQMLGVVAAALIAACVPSPDGVAAAAPPTGTTSSAPASTGVAAPEMAQLSPVPESSPASAPAEAPEAIWPVEMLMGDLSPVTTPGFKRVPAYLSSRDGMYGRDEAVDALIAMANAADKDGVKLTVVSAFRSFSDQTRIWEDKWTGKTRVEGGRLPETVPDPHARALKILEFSSMPGTSRHHWGTDFDLNNLNNAWFDSGEGKRVHDWLQANAATYGFCQPYSVKDAARPEGYSEERWHWSYRPLSAKMLAAYGAGVGPKRITGFAGSETAVGIDVIGKYVQGVNTACR
jgi:zinc D-Ala-D-Ala carboxypeptidase